MAPSGRSRRQSKIWPGTRGLLQPRMRGREASSPLCERRAKRRPPLQQNCRQRYSLDAKFTYPVLCRMILPKVEQAMIRAEAHKRALQAILQTKTNGLPQKVV